MVFIFDFFILLFFLARFLRFENWKIFKNSFVCIKVLINNVFLNLQPPSSLSPTIKIQNGLNEINGFTYHFDPNYHTVYSPFRMQKNEILYVIRVQVWKVDGDKMTFCPKSAAYQKFKREKMRCKCYVADIELSEWSMKIERHSAHNAEFTIIKKVLMFFFLFCYFLSHSWKCDFFLFICFGVWHFLNVTHSLFKFTCLHLTN